MDTSEELLKLVRTVGDLPHDDQVRILQIVDLLSLASSRVQCHTQRMLRDIIDADPDSKWECVAGVDEVIEYLEHAVLEADDYTGTWGRFDHASVGGNTQ